MPENYIQNSSHDPLRPGALGLGQATASTVVNVFYMVSYATPMLAGIVTDVYLGRFKTVFLSYRYRSPTLASCVRELLIARAAYTSWESLYCS